MAKGVVYYPIYTHLGIYPVLATLVNRSPDKRIEVSRLYLNNTVPYQTGTSFGTNLSVYKLQNVGDTHTQRFGNVTWNRFTDKSDPRIEAGWFGPTWPLGCDAYLMRNCFFVIGQNGYQGGGINDAASVDNNYTLLNFYDNDTQKLILRQNEGLCLYQGPNVGNNISLSVFIEIEYL